MTSPSPTGTPLTDAAMFTTDADGMNDYIDVVMYDFAKDLERRLQSSESDLERAREENAKWLAKAMLYKPEMDKARGLLREARTQLLMHDCRTLAERIAKFLGKS